ncbi:MAG: threonine ammonia-lyase [Rhodospirillales bacterium]|nr:threonine ammonia-lyase [Rhodospirillales bacterium]
MAVSIADIRDAAGSIAGQVKRTPSVDAPRLAELIGADRVVLKLESEQYTGSFKDRGALVKLLSLAPEERKSGVVAMSAGNHAQGVAYHARRLGVPATIVMPVGTPFGKIERTRHMGARVVVEGDGFDTAGVFAREMAAREGLVFVHPYDDDRIIAGQGTIGLEMLTDDADLDCLVVPIGGGGLIAGIATAVKALKPSIEVLGVEAKLYPSMYNAVRGLDPVSGGGTTIAEGIAVKRPGERTKPIVEALVSDILLVGEDTLERAVMQLIEVQKLVAEGAGAAGVAALMAYRERFAGRRVGTVICGGNIDSRMLAYILMRGLVRDGRMVRLRIEITDQPGALARLAGVIGKAGGNIIEIYHQRMFHDVPVKKADIDAVIETRNAEHVREIVQGLNAIGFPTRLLGTSSVDTSA